MILHNPHTVATPSQRLAAAAHSARLAKIAARARIEPLPSAPIVAAPVPAKPEPKFCLGTWIARQETLNPLPKKSWFSIESEIGPRRPSVDEVKRAVCDHFNVSVEDLLSPCRTAKICRPRQVGYYLAKKLTLKSLPEIGRRFGDRDHTSILSGIRKIDRLIPRDGSLAADVETIESKVRGATDGK